MNSENMAILECVIFLFILNFSICDKSEPKIDDIAPFVQISHYDCNEMTKNNLYSLNQVKPCKMFTSDDSDERYEIDYVY